MSSVVFMPKNGQKIMTTVKMQPTDKLSPCEICLPADFSSCFCRVMFVQETGDLYFPSCSLHETRSKNGLRIFVDLLKFQLSSFQF